MLKTNIFDKYTKRKLWKIELINETILLWRKMKNLYNKVNEFYKPSQDLAKKLIKILTSVMLIWIKIKLVKYIALFNIIDKTARNTVSLAWWNMFDIVKHQE